MSGAGGKRRSLLANAIDSLGTTPQPIAEPENIANAREEERPAEEPVAPSFLERRGIAFDEIARAVKKLTIRLKPSECSIWPGNARDHAALNYGRCASLIESIREEGTNREPVVVRRTLNGNLPYELIGD
jgi:ParB family chromosome partitioning protein